MTADAAAIPFRNVLRSTVLIASVEEARRRAYSRRRQRDHLCQNRHDHDLRVSRKAGMTAIVLLTPHRGIAAQSPSIIVPLGYLGCCGADAAWTGPAMPPLRSLISRMALSAKAVSLVALATMLMP